MIRKVSDEIASIKNGGLALLNVRSVVMRARRKLVHTVCGAEALDLRIVGGETDDRGK
jgi:hypothetical protein